MSVQKFRFEAQSVASIVVVASQKQAKDAPATSGVPETLARCFALDIVQLMAVLWRSTLSAPRGAHKMTP